MCAVRAPRRAPVPLPLEAPAAEEGTRAGERRLPTLEEEIARLVGSRDRAERLIEERLAGCEPREAMRFLAVVSQVARSVAAMVVQRGGGSGGREMERLLADAARIVRERHGGR